MNLSFTLKTPSEIKAFHFDKILNTPKFKLSAKFKVEKKRNGLNGFKFLIKLQLSEFGRMQHDDGKEKRIKKKNECEKCMSQWNFQQTEEKTKVVEYQIRAVKKIQLAMHINSMVIGQSLQIYVYTANTIKASESVCVSAKSIEIGSINSRRITQIQHKNKRLIRERHQQQLR